MGNFPLIFKANCCFFKVTTHSVPVQNNFPQVLTSLGILCGESFWGTESVKIGLEGLRETTEDGISFHNYYYSFRHRYFFTEMHATAQYTHVHTILLCYVCKRNCIVKYLWVLDSLCCYPNPDILFNVFRIFVSDKSPFWSYFKRKGFSRTISVVLGYVDLYYYCKSSSFSSSSPVPQASRENGYNIIYLKPYGSTSKE